MKAIGILGTSSNAGKSWFATALCAWLRQQGVKVAPFKAQNMSNNAFATQDGGEIGVAQAVQAAACGLTPRVEMNPVLLKPEGNSTSQLVHLGQAVERVQARHYYDYIESSWNVVTRTLEWWESQCDVLIMEGAGSPVELNITARDIANLKPIRHVDGRWILVADIERGGVFAQIAGTYALCSEEDRQRSLGYVINRFRGDPSLFPNPEPYLKGTCEQPYLGLLPLHDDLEIEEEDSLSLHHYCGRGIGPSIAWIRLPHISNSQDIQAWRKDTGVHVHWAKRPEDIAEAAAIILPGSKNTLADLEWLECKGLAKAIRKRAASGTQIVGICGGYQMLGQSLSDSNGIAGAAGKAQGLGLLPMQTKFQTEKIVAPRKACFDDETWPTFEIHSGHSTIEWSDAMHPLLYLIEEDQSRSPEGVSHGNIWGSYQHGLFDSASMRRRLVEAAGIQNVDISTIRRQDAAEQTFTSMATLLEEQLDLDAIKRHLKI